MFTSDNSYKGIATSKKKPPTSLMRILSKSNNLYWFPVTLEITRKIENTGVFNGKVMMDVFKKSLNSRDTSLYPNGVFDEELRFMRRGYMLMSKNYLTALAMAEYIQSNNHDKIRMLLIDASDYKSVVQKAPTIDDNCYAFKGDFSPTVMYAFKPTSLLTPEEVGAFLSRSGKDEFSDFTNTQAKNRLETDNDTTSDTSEPNSVASVDDLVGNIVVPDPIVPPATTATATPIHTSVESVMDSLDHVNETMNGGTILGNYLVDDKLYESLLRYKSDHHTAQGYKREISVSLGEVLKDHPDLKYHPAYAKIIEPLDGQDEKSSKAEGVVYSTVATWASTSGDHNKSAIETQVAACQLFDLGDPETLMPHLNVNMAEPESGRVKATKAVLNEMYEKTQKYLKANGIDKIHLFRGMYWLDKPKHLPQLLFNGRVQDISLTTQPISSFSTNLDIAKSFSQGADDFDAVGSEIFSVILYGQVPVERILSCYRTGMGCYDEEEFTIIGGVDNWKALSFTENVPEVYDLTNQQMISKFLGN
ncbi:hypothetical protein HSE3_gp023 [Bacillus phage vB_BceM-HSE3]|nr:hypothetical protein HSE3_gp023 [Bacillus phage vB_BceM-HSE3]